MDTALIKSLLGVFFTLGFLFFLAVQLKKIHKTQSKGKLLQLKETLNLTSKSKIVIIKVGEENMLFSISEKEVVFIKDIPSFEKSLQVEIANHE